jgi:serine/threonine-protein kinase
MPSFFTELRRRNVFKVGAAYAIVAWLLIEVSSVLLPTFNAPEWIMQVFTLFVLLGFPLALLLSWAYEMTPEGIKADADVPRDSITPATGQRLNYVILGLVVLAVGFLVTDQYVLDEGIRASVVGTSRSVVTTSTPTRSTPSTRVRRTSIILGATEPIGGSLLNANVALSSDARRLAYVVQAADRTQLYLRELDQVTARALPGTEGAFGPSFSPDGEWILFTVEEELRKISVRGGSSQTLAREARDGAGMFWTANDTVIFPALTPEGLYRLHSLSAAGGTPELLDGLSEVPGFTHGWPHVLPGGDHMLFTVRPNDGQASDGHIAILSMDTGESKTLIESAYNARYTASGHIVFMRSASLWAVPFDLETLGMTGPEVPVVNGVQTNSPRGPSVFTVSGDGLLVYLPGVNTYGLDNLRTLVWVDREGREESLEAEPRFYQEPRLSPDGRRLAVMVTTDNNEDIWIYDLVRGTLSPLTFTPGSESGPLWTPDGRRLLFRSERDESEGGSGLFSQLADGTGQEMRLMSSSNLPRAVSFSPDGHQLVFEAGGFRNRDLHLLSLEEEPTSQPLLHEEFDERHGVISPDGRWLAYSSDESGRYEIYVRPFPNVDDGKWQVSTAGGWEPLWGPLGSELFYRLSTTLIVVPFEDEPTFSPGRPGELFTGPYVSNGLVNYDVSANGQRFLMMKESGELQRISGQTVLTVVDNWFEELNRLAPPSP